ILIVDASRWPGNWLIPAQCATFTRRLNPISGTLVPTALPPQSGFGSALPQEEIMPQNLLEQLRKYTVVVADTGDIEAMEKFRPQDATTNPSLITAAGQRPQYQPIVA